MNISQNKQFNRFGSSRRRCCPYVSSLTLSLSIVGGLLSSAASLADEKPQVAPIELFDSLRADLPEFMIEDSVSGTQQRMYQLRIFFEQETMQSTEDTIVPSRYEYEVKVPQFVNPENLGTLDSLNAKITQIALEQSWFFEDLFRNLPTEYFKSAPARANAFLRDQGLLPESEELETEVPAPVVVPESATDSRQAEGARYNQPEQAPEYSEEDDLNAYHWLDCFGYYSIDADVRSFENGVLQLHFDYARYTGCRFVFISGGLRHSNDEPLQNSETATFDVNRGELIESKFEAESD